MKLPKLVQTIVNDFCVQTGEKYVHAGSLHDLLFDIDPAEANAFLARPDINEHTKLNPAPVAI